MRAALLALISIPAGACATASYDDPPPDSLLLRSDNGGRVDSGGSVNSSAGSSGSPASAGKSAVSGGSGGTAPSGGSSGHSSGAAGKGATSSGGMNSGGSGSGAGKGGSSSAGTTSGGTSSTAGKGGTSSSAGGMNSAGATSAGASSGGTSGGAICDAAHAVASITTSQSYTGKADDCVRLVVEKSWSVVNVQLQPLPGTQGYPVPFTFFNCGGNGTGSLTADYANVSLKSGANPGCDFFVQFGGGGTTIKVTYYD